MRVKDGELVAVVLQEPVLGLGLELEAVRARGRVAPGDVALGGVALEDDQAAGLVRLLGPGKSATLVVTLKKGKKYTYICTVPGHAAAGMKGTFKAT